MPNLVHFDQPLPSIRVSQELYQRAFGLIPCCTQTMAKGPTQYVDGSCPKYLVRGRGGHVWDADNNEYIDLTMAVGPVVLGYAHPEVDAAICQQLRDGITFSLMHPLEVEVAEMVRQYVPGAEMVRFSKTGADVTSAAVRLARAYTGRERVLCSGYHGWHDWYIGTSSHRRGVPGSVQGLARRFERDDLEEMLDRIDHSVACIILEPVVFERPSIEYLHKLRSACDAQGVVLIFDEMWTGFRLALGGAQEYFQVRADLACFSKAIANGMPLSVLTGRRDIMGLLEEDVFVYTTFGGEALSLAAAQATMHELARWRVPEQLASKGRRLKDGFNQLAWNKGVGYVRAVGLEARCLIEFDPDVADPLEQKSLLQEELLRHGVLWSGFHNLCLAHSEADLEHVLGAYDRALDALNDAVLNHDLRSRLHGIPVRPLFRPVR